MSYPINYPTPQNANVQIFYAPKTSDVPYQTWVKPQGASFVWFTLIGAGGSGDGSSGGGSGAVTNFMCPAFLIPDNLNIAVGIGSGFVDTYIYYQDTQILYAYGGSGVSGGSSMGNNFFTAMGFLTSTSGQSGSTGSTTASTSTFLSGGANGTSAANYGYSSENSPGFFQMQPIIVGTGGSLSGRGGIGCGGSYDGYAGGDGLVVIITW